MGTYFIIGMFYILVYLWTRGKSTGLKWDPASPLDLLALVANTNAHAQLGGVPLNMRRAFLDLSPEVRWRVGYWEREFTRADGTTERTLAYGIGMRNYKCKCFRITFLF